VERKYTILLVEDESSAVYAIESYFTGAGYKVLTAFSAQSGLDVALKDHPDVTILDVIMPASNGLDILPEIRKDAWGQTAKIVIFSNSPSEEFKAIAHKYSVEKYLVKTDTSLKELEEVIKQILSKHDS